MKFSPSKDTGGFHLTSAWFSWSQWDWNCSHFMTSDLLDHDNCSLVSIGTLYPNIVLYLLLRSLQGRSSLILSSEEIGTDWFVKWFWMYWSDTNGIWLCLLVIFQLSHPVYFTRFLQFNTKLFLLAYPWKMHFPLFLFLRYKCNTCICWSVSLALQYF